MPSKLSFFIMVLFSVSLVSALPYYFTPLSNSNAVQRNVTFQSTINLTLNSDGTGVILTNTSNFTTDDRGLAFLNINISGLSSIPNYIIESRNGAVRITHLSNDQIFRELYVKQSNTSNSQNTNLSIDDTLTLTQMTLGSILFTTTNGRISQNNLALRWNETIAQIYAHQANFTNLTVNNQQVCLANGTTNYGVQCTLTTANTTTSNGTLLTTSVNNGEIKITVATSVLNTTIQDLSDLADGSGWVLNQLGGYLVNSSGILYNESRLNITIYNLSYPAYVSRNDWTTHDAYPSGCSAGQFVTTIGDTLTCAVPSNNGNWQVLSPYLMNTSGSIAVNESMFNATIVNLTAVRYVSRNDWTTIDNYPSGCSAGQFVSTIGDTLTCGTPAGDGSGWMINQTGLLNDSSGKIGLNVTFVRTLDTYNSSIDIIGVINKTGSYRFDAVDASIHCSNITNTASNLCTITTPGTPNTTLPNGTYLSMTIVGNTIYITLEENATNQTTINLGDGRYIRLGNVANTTVVNSTVINTTGDGPYLINTRTSTWNNISQNESMINSTVINLRNNTPEYSQIKTFPSPCGAGQFVNTLSTGACGTPAGDGAGWNINDPQGYIYNNSGISFQESILNKTFASLFSLLSPFTNTTTETQLRTGFPHDINLSTSNLTMNNATVLINLTVAGRYVCLADGTNCRAERGNTTNEIQGVERGNTSEEMQDSVGAILTDTPSVDFTYNDGADQISAVSSGNTSAQIIGVINKTGSYRWDAVDAAIHCSNITNTASNLCTITTTGDGNGWVVVGPYIINVSGGIGFSESVSNRTVNEIISQTSILKNSSTEVYLATGMPRNINLSTSNVTVNNMTVLVNQTIAGRYVCLADGTNCRAERGNTSAEIQAAMGGSGWALNTSNGFLANTTGGAYFNDTFNNITIINLRNNTPRFDKLTDYPSACTPQDVVQGVGSTLTCVHQRGNTTAEIQAAAGTATNETYLIPWQNDSNNRVNIKPGWPGFVNVTNLSVEGELNGGILPGGNLLLTSTASSTKGEIQFGSNKNMSYSEINHTLQIGTIKFPNVLDVGLSNLQNETRLRLLGENSVGAGLFCSGSNCIQNIKLFQVNNSGGIKGYEIQSGGGLFQINGFPDYVDQTVAGWKVYNFIDHILSTNTLYLGLGDESMGSTVIISPTNNTARFGNAKTLSMDPVLRATADNDKLYGIHLTPTFYDDGFTGIKHYGIVIGEGNNGFNASRPNATLEVNGTLRLDGFASCVLNTDYNGVVTCSSNGTSGSGGGWMLNTSSLVNDSTGKITVLPSFVQSLDTYNSSEQMQDAVGVALTNSSSTEFAYDDSGNRIVAYSLGNTSEQMQDAVGNILTDTASVDFTYNDGADQITAVASGNTSAQIQSASANESSLIPLFNDSTQVHLKTGFPTALNLSGVNLTVNNVTVVTNMSIAGRYVCLSDKTNCVAERGNTSVEIVAAVGGTGWSLNNSNSYVFNSSLGFGWNLTKAVGEFVNRSLWTTIDNYPSGCSAGQFVSTIGDTLTCGTPSGDGSGWSLNISNGYLANTTGGAYFNDSFNNITIINLRNNTPLWSKIQDFPNACSIGKFVSGVSGLGLTCTTPSGTSETLFNIGQNSLTDPDGTFIISSGHKMRINASSGANLAYFDDINNEVGITGNLSLKNNIVQNFGSTRFTPGGCNNTVLGPTITNGVVTQKLFANIGSAPSSCNYTMSLDVPSSFAGGQVTLINVTMYGTGNANGNSWMRMKRLYALNVSTGTFAVIYSNFTRDFNVNNHVMGGLPYIVKNTPDSTTSVNLDVEFIGNHSTSTFDVWGVTVVWNTR